MRKDRAWIYGGAVLGVVLLAGLAFAQTKRYFQNAGFEGHRLAFLTAALDLTDAQVEQVKQIHAAEQPKYQALRQNMKAAATELQPLIATDNFDESKVRAAIAGRQQVMQDMMVEHAREMNAVYKILTPAQRDKAVKLFQNFGHFGPGGHGGRFHHSAPSSDTPSGE